MLDAIKPVMRKAREGTKAGGTEFGEVTYPPRLRKGDGKPNRGPSKLELAVIII